MLNKVRNLLMVKCLSKILKRSQVLHLMRLNDTKHVVNELHGDGFVEWVPPPNTFVVLEELDLMLPDNLEAVGHGPIPLGSFINLRILRLWNCKRLKCVFFLPVNKGE